jgi:hypothetical protein
MVNIMRFPKPQNDCMKNSVMLTGIFRSGTTILGKIMGSFKNVEYSYDPPIISTLDYANLNGKLDGECVSGIFGTYMAQDIMLNYHHGRGYNIRVNDGSCIFNMKSHKEIEQRLKINGVNEASKLMYELNSRLIWKSVVRFSIIPIFMKHYENFKVVEIERDLKRLLSSLIKIGWFNKNEMKSEKYMGIWPYKEGYESKIPYMVSKETADLWDNSNVETNVARLLNDLTKIRFDIKKIVKEQYPGSYLTIKYEDLLDNTSKVVNKIEKFTGMKRTSISEKWIKDVKQTKAAFDIDDIISKIEPSVLELLEKNNKLLGYN